MKKHTKSILVSSLLAVAFGAMSVGTTFALFTSETKTTINVESGIVDVKSSLTNPTLYSASATYTTGDVAGTLTGAFAGTYYYEPQPGLMFANGGSVSLENSILGIQKMTPGDKVSGELGFVNNSNVNIKYRFVVNTSSDSDDILLSNMVFKVLGETYVGLKNMKTNWMELDALEAISGTTLEVILPLEAGNENQNKTASYAFSVEAVQANAQTVDDAFVSYVTSTYIPLDSNEIDSESKLTTEKVVEAPLPNAQSESEVVTVTVPENAKLNDGASSLTLYVENLGEDEDYQGISIEVDQGAENYEVTLEGLNETNTQPVEVSINLGYEPLAVYHTHGNVTTPVDFDYDSVTGITTFSVTNFSEFTFVRETDIIEVPNLAKLKLIRNFVNQGNSLAGKTIKLLADIDISDEDWYPIGTKANPFNGTFDGNNHVIKGLTATSNLDLSALDSKKAFGFIGMIGTSNVTIKDVEFTDVSINLPSSDIVGVALGYAPSSATGNVTVQNVKVSGLGISAKDCPAGIVGKAYNTGSLVIENCVTDIIIESAGRAAGICGYVSGPSSAKITGNTIKKNVYANSTGVDMIALFVGVGKDFVYDNNNEIGKMYYQGEEFIRDYSLTYTYDLEGNVSSVTYSNFVNNAYGASHNAAHDVKKFNDGTIINKYAPTSDMECQGNVTIIDMDFSLNSANSLKILSGSTVTIQGGTFRQIDTKSGATVYINGGNYGVEGNSNLGIRNAGGDVYLNHLDSYTSNVLNYENTGTYHMNCVGNFMVYDSLNDCHETTEHTFTSDHGKVTYIVADNLGFEILDDSQTVGTYRHLNILEL